MIKCLHTCKQLSGMTGKDGISMILRLLNDFQLIGMCPSAPVSLHYVSNKKTRGDIKDQIFDYMPASSASKDIFSISVLTIRSIQSNLLVGYM